MTHDLPLSPYRLGQGVSNPPVPHPGEVVDDAAVIERSWTRPELFAEIYGSHVVEIHKYVARRLGPDAADDLVANTFLIAFQQRKRFDPSLRSARPWLYGIATNLMRRHRRQELAFYRALARTGGAPADDTHEERVAARLSAQRLRPELMRALTRLSAGDRDVLLLTALADLSREEIAQALDIPTGTVGSRLHRARKKLRAALPPTLLTSEPEFDDE